ncbi:salicylate hydroxylase [Roseibium aquae]|uniref:Salicylate hydroxylase n=1 Tax=Roseibium aquae TaxID=1323746 RepID=A0A916TMF7_9HYPH|nr:FAD-dependent monooxygenase [Roseibium aquae]GGB59484.1 salicylate hydroxylase [Roseibium aquae]
MTQTALPGAPIIIAGAGIGGLSAALALNQAGFPVHLVEKAPDIQEVGAGLQLSPNACAVLDLLGVLDSVRQAAFQPERIRIRSGTTGKDLAAVPLGRDARDRYGYPYLVVHRADLQNALLSQAEKNPGIDIRLGASLTRPEQTPSGSILCHVESLHGDDMLEGRALIAADGVWSRLRPYVRKKSGARFTGQTAYRATLPADGLPPHMLRDTGLWMGPNAHVVHYPIKAGRELNVIVLIKEDWQEESWSGRADRTTVMQALSGWYGELRDLVERPDHWLKWALCGVPASGGWTNGPIALLGDAAHAMLPFAAQGAAMAIEDAAVLAQCLADGTANVSRALKAYEAARKERVRKVQDLAARNASIYHMSGPLALARNTAMRMMGPHRMAAQMAWVYGWKPPKAAARPPLT